MAQSVAEQLAAFRKDAYFKSPDFGARVDQLILQGQGLGDAATPDLGTSLTSLSQGLADIAKAANLSVAQYYDSMTSINQMRAAYGQGLTTTQYTAAQQATSGTANAATANVLGIPLWIILGGAAVLFVAMKPHGRR